MALSVAQYATVSDWFSTLTNGQTKTVTGLSWSAGDIIVVITGSEGGLIGGVNVTMTPSNANLTFGAAQATVGSGSGVDCYAAVWSATAASAQSSQTITLTVATGGAVRVGGSVWVVTGAPGGTVNATADLNESNFSLTTFAGSVVIYGLMDFNATSPPNKTPSTGSGSSTEELDSTGATGYSQYLADWVGTTASTASFGPNNYTSLQVAQVVIEVTTVSVEKPTQIPVVQTTAETAVTTAGTSHAITLPSGMGASDLILITMDIGSTSATMNALTDWTEILDESAANGLKIWWYTGAGVPANPTFTSSGSTRSATIAWRISGADKNITPQIGTTSTGTSANPAPPAVTPTQTLIKNYLFVTFIGMAGEEADDDTWANTPPTNYLPNPPLQIACGTVGTNLGGLICAASRQLKTGATQTPGTFNVDVSAAYRGQTICIHGTPNPILNLPTILPAESAAW